MSINNLDRIFEPRRIAVIGASDQAAKVGHRVLRNLVGSGYEGTVYPVNSRREAVQGIQAYPEVGELPRVPDLAIVCTPGRTVPNLVRECGEAGIHGMVILSAGFSEVGEEGRKLQEQIRVAAADFPESRIIGPNCLGFIVPGLSLNASFAAATPKPGNVAFISQSGALCTAILDQAIEQEMGFSHFVSIGNMIDVDFADLIDYFGEQEETHSIILYVESIPRAREFMSAARAFARTKPIVAYKAGRYAESAEAAASHTGSMAGDDAVFDAAARRAGIERVYDVDDMFDCAGLLARGTPPRSSRLAIVTNAGGPGVMATDTLMDLRGRLATISDATMRRLDDLLPPSWSHGNPVDVLGDAPPERLAESLQLVLADDGVDAALVVLAPQAMTDPTESGRAVGEVARESRKPVLAAWMGGASVRQGERKLNRAGVPTYVTPEQAVRAFMHLVSYARNLETLYETPRDIPVAFALDREERAEHTRALLASGADDPTSRRAGMGSTQEPKGATAASSHLLDERTAKELLRAYQIPVTLPERAATPEEAVAAARGVGYPVVMKIQSRQISHKSDVGGVKVGLDTDEQVENAFDRMVTSARTRRPEARIDGVTVQPMVAVEEGVELIVGAKVDPTFGAVILVGMGGITAEVYRDIALELPPLNERLARRMLESLRSWPLLRGYRGRPAANVDRLIETLIRFSYLVADHPALREIDINPLLVTADHAIALDARARVDQNLLDDPPVPFGHLAIRPYPEHYVHQAEMPDGTRVVLRPIKPEDEPMWHALLASCSPESIRSRFFSVFRETTHQMATRYCFIDYDREMAIVAEVEEHDERKLLAVGRLVADPDHDTAEYAVLVADPAQGRGLGRLLTAYCLEVARDWGLGRVTATTLPENSRMIKILETLDFEVRHDLEDRMVYAERAIGWSSPDDRAPTGGGPTRS